MVYIAMHAYMNHIIKIEQQIFLRSTFLSNIENFSQRLQLDQSLQLNHSIVPMLFSSKNVDNEYFSTTMLDQLDDKTIVILCLFQLVKIHNSQSIKRESDSIIHIQQFQKLVEILTIKRVDISDANLCNV
jgi:hypothetical protein